MKKKLLLIITLVLVLALVASVMVACNQNGSPSDDNDGDDSGIVDGGGDTDGDGSGDTGEDDTNPDDGNNQGVGEGLPFEVLDSVGLEYELNTDNQSYTVTGIGTFEGSMLKIPELHEGLPVTDIAQGAFQYCDDLFVVIVGNNVKQIERYAFYACYNIVHVTVGSSVKYIGDDAFADCLKLNDLYNLSCLNMQYLSYEHGGIASSALNIYTASEGKCNLALQNEYIYFEYQDTYYLKGYLGKDTELTLPDSINNQNYCIDSYTFINNKSIVNVVMPNSVTYVYNSAFKNCISLKSVTISNKIEVLGSDLFENCASLTTVNFAEDSRLKEIGGFTFADCVSLQSIILPDSLTEVGYYAFQNCTSLENITMGNNVKTIKEGAFNSCDGLNRIVIPASVTEIEDNAFLCRKLVEVCNLSSLDIIASETAHGGVARYAKNVVQSTTLSNLSIENDYVFYNDNNTYYLVDYNGNDKKLILPDDINGNSYIINKNAFYKNFDIVSVTVSSGVLEIQDDAFFSCENLLEVYNFSNLDIQAGKNFHGSIANSAEDVYTSSSAQSNIFILNDFVFHNNDGKYVLKGYVGDDFDLTLPSTVFGRSYTIGDHAFAENTKIVSVYIPDTVTAIGAGAFMDCYSLTNIRLSNTITVIEPETFYSCENLTSITIPDSVIKIRYSAFTFCKELKDLYIGSGVKEIEWSAFDICENLRELVIPDNVVSIEMGCFNRCYRLEKVTLGKGITTISEYLFAGCNNLQSVEILGDVTSIGFEAFEECEKLKTINIPSSLKIIYDRAFAGCINLDNIELPENMEEIGSQVFNDTLFFNNPANWQDDVLYIGSYLISAKQSLSGSYITNRYTTIIASEAFKDCTLLNEIVISYGIKYIGDFAFNGCTSLNKVEIANTIKYIADSAFDETTPVAIWENGVLYLDEYLLKAEKTLSGTYEIKQGTKIIAENAFSDCTMLEGITIPDSVVYIGDSAFYNCTSLRSVTLPNSVRELGDRAFALCEKLYSVTMNDYINTIGDYTFAQTRLEEIDLPNAVVRIGDYAFSSCHYLDSVIMNNNVEYIGEEAFGGCTGLNYINIPDSVIEISDNAFRFCINLNTVKIGSGVKHIGFNAFMDCEELVEVYIDDMANWCNIDFANIYANPLSYAGVLDTNLGVCKSLVIPDDVQSISNYAFYGCTSITSVTLPSTVTNVGLASFGGCTQLSKITLPFIGQSKDSNRTNFGYIFGALFYHDNADYVPASLHNVSLTGDSKIDDYAFYQCANIQSVSIADTVETIGESAFMDCSSLMNCTFTKKSQLNTIDDSAFYNCIKLNDINLPDGLTTLGNNAFSNCENLYDLFIPSSVVQMGAEVFAGCTDLTIFSQSSSLPSGWDNSWNPADRLVVWNCNGQYGTAPGLLNYATLNDNTVAIIGYIGFMSTVEISSTVNDKPVTCIYERAFKDCTVVESVVIPSSVTNIGAFAFDGCDNLTTVYYGGTSEQWEKLQIDSHGNDAITSATIYYFSENEPTPDGNYWHYDVYGVPTKW